MRTEIFSYLNFIMPGILIICGSADANTVSALLQHLGKVGITSEEIKMHCETRHYTYEEYLADQRRMDALIGMWDFLEVPCKPPKTVNPTNISCFQPHHLIRKMPHSLSGVKGVQLIKRQDRRLK